MEANEQGHQIVNLIKGPFPGFGSQNRAIDIILEYLLV